MKKILITGARGFIGSALEKYLESDKSYEVICADVDNCSLTSIGPIQELLNSVRPDYIIHLAGGRMTDPKLLEESNLLTTKNLCDAVSGMTDYAPQIVLTGSAAEYGKMPEGKQKFQEDDAVRPLSLYGKVKNQQVQMGLAYAQQGMHVCVARIFNIIGPQAPEALASGRFARQIVDMEEGADLALKVWSLSGKRDFVDIEDVVRALLDIAVKGAPGEIYNVCSGEAVEIRGLVQKMIAASKVEGIRIDEDVSKGQDSFDCVGSFEKLKDLSGWQPKYSLDQSIGRLLESYRYENSDRA